MASLSKHYLSLSEAEKQDWIRAYSDDINSRMEALEQERQLLELILELEKERAKATLTSRKRNR